MREVGEKESEYGEREKRREEWQESAREREREERERKGRRRLMNRVGEQAGELYSASASFVVIYRKRFPEYYNAMTINYAYIACVGTFETCLYTPT